jgi:hypothetical protein
MLWLTTAALPVAPLRQIMVEDAQVAGASSQHSMQSQKRGEKRIEVESMAKADEHGEDGIGSGRA